MSVKRFYCATSHGLPSMKDHADGEYVSFDDYSSLMADIKEWACEKCNTVYPGPPQHGISCVVCPKCSGPAMPHELFKRRAVEAQRDELLEALKIMRNAFMAVMSQSIEEKNVLRRANELIDKHNNAAIAKCESK